MAFFEEETKKNMAQTKPSEDTLFVAQISNALQFRDILSALNTVNSEPTIRVARNGISSKFMNEGHQIEMIFDYPKSVMDEFCPFSEDIGFCLNLDSLLKKNVFKDINKDTSLKLSLIKVDKGKKGNTVSFELKDKITRKFQLGSLEPATEEAPLPKISFTVKARMYISTLLRVVNNAEDLDQNIRIEADYNKLAFKNVDKDRGEFESVFNKEDEEVISLETQRNDTAYSVVMSLEWLKPILQSFKKLSDVVTLEFGTDRPLKLTPDLNEISLTYYQAPRIDNEN